MERLEKFGRRLYPPAIQEMVSRDARETTRRRQVTPELCALEESERVSICEVLDRVLNKGVVGQAR